MQHLQLDWTHKPGLIVNFTRYLNTESTLGPKNMELHKVP